MARWHDGSAPALELAFGAGIRVLRQCVFWLGLTAAGGAVCSDSGWSQQRVVGGQEIEAVERIRQWERLIEEGRTYSEPARLAAVNDFFNDQVTFVEDRLAWGVDDYWATPLEVLTRAVGDCEDFSIAKYVTLSRMGVPVEQLRLTYVRADLGMFGAGTPQAHMVLAYYPEPGGEPLVLDNLVTAIRPASQRPDLQPVFGFNSEGLWLGGVRASAGPAARLSRWRNVLARMSSEGSY